MVKPISSPPRFDPAATGWVEPVTLEGRVVRLEPLTLDHLDDLAEVAFEGNLWRWTMVQPANRDELRAWVEAAVRTREAGTELAFATVDRSTGKAIGSS